MHDSVIESKLSPSQPNYLWFLTLTYTMVMTLSNWFDPRLIKLFGLTTEAGTLIFPLTFLLSDLITEVYGFKYARRAIWCGFLFNAIFIIYGQLVIHMPSPSFATNNASFDAIFASSSRIIFASIISYLISEPLNSFIMAKLKIKMHGRHLGLRFALSTIFASAIDSFTFGSIAFYGIIANDSLINLIITMWAIKSMIEIIGLPLSISLTNKLKRIEKLDIYDKRTDFNLFTFDVNYTKSDNEFTEK